MTYRPIDRGDDNAEIAVWMTGWSDPYLINITGSGATDPLQTDTFSTGDVPKVDVLFVVDNSSTMADKQTALANNLAAFIADAVQQPVDYHVAVTTTDVTATGEAGRILPTSGTNPRVVTPSTTNGVQVFTQNAAVGTSGSETESLLRPAYLALTNPNIAGDNAGFYRDEAKLAVIIISDAADQDPLTTPVSFYETFLLNLKGNKRRSDLMVGAIVPTQAQAPAGCTYDTAAAGLDTRVSQFVQHTGGLLGDICDANWATVLQRMGEQIFFRRETFFLSNIPDLTVTPNPIAVAIDNVPYAQFGARGEKRWDYSGSTNAVVFDPQWAPLPASTLTISYRVACL